MVTDHAGHELGVGGQVGGVCRRGGRLGGPRGTQTQGGDENQERGGEGPPKCRFHATQCN